MNYMKYNLLLMTHLPHGILVDSSTVICWMSPYFSLNIFNCHTDMQQGRAKSSTNISYGPSHTYWSGVRSILSLSFYIFDGKSCKQII